jgi:hypothetical protein
VHPEAVRTAGETYELSDRGVVEVDTVRSEKLWVDPEYDERP